MVLTLKKKIRPGRETRIAGEGECYLKPKGLGRLMKKVTSVKRPKEVTKQPGGCLGEENPSWANGRWQCPKLGACWASDHLSLWPFWKEGIGRAVWFCKNTLFPHANISNVFLPRYIYPVPALDSTNTFTKRKKSGCVPCPWVHMRTQCGSGLAQRSWGLHCHQQPHHYQALSITRM